MRRKTRPYGLCMETYIAEYASLKFFILYALQAVALLSVGVVSLMAFRQSRWAIAGALGGFLSGFVAAVLAYGWAVLEFSNSTSVFDFMNESSIVGGFTDWGMTVGLVLISLAFVTRVVRATPA